MINLLPYDENKQTRAARTNLVLLRFIIFLGLAIGFLVLACASTYFLIVFMQSQNKQISELNTDTIYSNSAPKNQEDSLTTAKSILDQQLSYYSVISGIGSVLPTGTIIDSLSIDENSINSTVNLNIYSTTPGFESKVKEGFQKSSIFSNYQLVKEETPQTDRSDYKFSIEISVIINRAVIQ